ncbi:hypothetical protein BGX28_004043 [Mortierella sp. GBA30]|nr:hypothetical protein BGX28_004043 [Mortierella sp. GBA30]
MSEATILLTRKPRHVPESATVDMTETNTAIPNVCSTSAAVEYTNSSQQQQQNHRQDQHYNIMIPTMDHWPALFVQYARKGISFVSKATKHLSHGYKSVATAASDENDRASSSSSISSSSRTITFGSKRQLKRASHVVGCSGRRLGRILFVSCVVVLAVSWILLPKSMKPFHNRDVWVRFFDHEEPVKITLPYRHRIHVQDVKKIALKEMDFGYKTSHVLGNVRLLSATGSGWLKPDWEWDDKDWRYSSESNRPIIAIENRYGCFSDASAFKDVFSIKFQPEYNEYQVLSDILWFIYEGSYRSILNRHIQYLRRGSFDGPNPESL